jgi:hypothetical protein
MKEKARRGRMEKEEEVNKMKGREKIYGDRKEQQRDKH